MTHPEKTLGLSITYKYWADGCDLLKFQIDQKKHNNFYRTASIFSYERIMAEYPNIKSEKYYKERVANNLFYGLEKEFGFLDYAIPKNGLGMRRFKLTTFSTRATYYCVGLYLIHLTQEFRSNVLNNRNKIKAYSGGNLFFESEKLVFNHKNTYYRDFYKQFKKEISQQTHKNTENRLVLKLDVQNFYDNVNIDKLLNCITDKIKHSTKIEFGFDEYCKQNISFFFSWLSNGKGGIPQQDNDLISAFLGVFYTQFIDLKVSEYIRSKSEITDFYILRYVDDAYIFVEFSPDTPKSKREEIAELLMSQVSDIYYFQFGLQLNQKTEPFWLSEPESVNRILNSLKKVSVELPQPPEQDPTKTTEDKVEEIIEALEALKSADEYVWPFPRVIVSDDTMKNVFDKDVNNLLGRPDIKQRLCTLFAGRFNFDRVKVRPFEISILICKHEETRNLYEKYLCSKQVLTSRDLDLILKFLCQTDFQSQQLLLKLKESEIYSALSTSFIGSNSSPCLGYFGLEWDDISLFVHNSNVIDQIRLRSYYEKQGAYSIALNHLLNEVHSICRQLEKGDKHYDSNSVCDFFSRLVFDEDICLSIRNLFDRRNWSPVSHPGSEKLVATGVSETEYRDFREYVEKALQHLIPKWRSSQHIDTDIQNIKVTAPPFDINDTSSLTASAI